MAHINMDSRKFLRLINNSAQSKVSYFSKIVETLGKKRNADWQLVSLLESSIIFEDKASHQFYTADYNRVKGGKINITNISQIQIHEDQKSDLFEGVCNDLISAIEEGNQTKIDSSFNKMAGNRFRSRAIPESGVVTTKDGITRHIPVYSDVVEETKVETLAASIVEALSDQVVIGESGDIVSGTFIESGVKFSIPNIGAMHRRAVADNMRQKAKAAYLEEGFQKFVAAAGSCVCENKITEGTKNSVDFLREYQEFSLLTKDEFVDLVSSTFATMGVFNEDLINDTAEMLYETNLTVNKEDILKAWSETAKNDGHLTVLEDIYRLQKSETFSESYDNFLVTIFESKLADEDRDAMFAALQLLQQQVSEKGSDIVAADEVKKLADQLKSNPSDEVVSRARQLLAMVGDTMQNVAKLQDFDNLPGVKDEMGDLVDEPEQAEALPEPEAKEETEEKGDQIVINVKPGEEQVVQTAKMPVDEVFPKDNEEIDLGDSFDFEEEEESKEKELVAAEATQTPAPEQTVNEVKQARVASKADAEEPRVKDIDLLGDEEEEEIEESYNFKGSVASLNHDYKSIKESNDDVKKLEDFAKGQKVDPKNMPVDALSKLADSMVASDTESQKLSDDQKKKKAQEIVQKYTENVTESQRKSPVKVQNKRAGLKRAAIKESLKWVVDTKDAKIGNYKGIDFVVELADRSLSSLDNGMKVPIPENVVKAFASFITEAESEDADTFAEWFAESIEQLRPVSQDENAALAEAILSVTVDGPKIDAKVDTDSVASPAAPVVAVDAAVVPTPVVAPEVLGDASEAQEEAQEDAQEDEESIKEAVAKAIGEDKDITSPESKKYDTTRQDPREPAEGAKLGNSGNTMAGVMDNPKKKVKEVKVD